MSQSFAQLVPADSHRAPDGVSGTFASAPRFHQAGDKPRPILGLEIRRSLQLHRRLAVGLSLIGVALALIYLLNSWNIRTALTLNEPAALGRIAESSLERTTAKGTRLELRRAETAVRSAVREPLVGRPHRTSFRIGNSPGLSGLAAAAVTPWYSADSEVIRNALVLILSFVFLGGAIAVVAHRADPRVYIAADVEHLLGFPPMVQLPDFSEVTDEITDEHLLRLASGIDLGFRDRGFRRCVFTGSGPEVGVTTIAIRLKSLLESLGRAVVVVDAAESLKLAEEAQGKIVLIDAAPLGDSEETERLVQSAHCSIVVIESGVTTRAQLRTVANTLQRVKAPAVGFVLNRVRLATADPEFRRSIKEMGKQIRKQGNAPELQMLQTLEQAIEEGRASLDLDDAASRNRPAEQAPEKIAKSVPQFNEGFQADRPVTAKETEPSSAVPVRGLQLVSRSQPEPAKQAHEQIPSPLDEIASQFDQLHPEPKGEPIQAPPAPARAASSKGTSHDPANPAPEKTTRLSLPRLSELRGMRFSQAIRELDHAKHPGSPSTGIEALMSAIAPFEPMFTRTEISSAKNGDSHETLPDELDLPASLRAFIPISEPGVSPEANGGAAAQSSGATVNHSHSDSVSPKSRQLAKNAERRAEEEEEPQPEEKAARQKLRGPFEQLQILPSRRGQYKKKG